MNACKVCKCEWMVNGCRMVGQWLANGGPMVGQWLANALPIAGQWLANGWQWLFAFFLYNLCVWSPRACIMVYCEHAPPFFIVICWLQPFHRCDARACKHNVMSYDGALCAGCSDALTDEEAKSWHPVDAACVDLGTDAI